MTLNLFILVFSRLFRVQLFEFLVEEDLFDLTYLTVAWFSFLPTLLAPFVVSHWLRAGWLANQCLSLFLAEALGVLDERDLLEEAEENLFLNSGGGGAERRLSHMPPPSPGGGQQVGELLFVVSYICGKILPVPRRP